ncbi:hypothetical protein J3A78_002115 [Streptomyces sp. PvR006]|uniref:hypothetical protein n=1 Tax=Streptomyces sp. PvR006 TaxID=2817860 RepID=UPI001AE53347|nr:hypothetical protein [Streptomyces sp. PvR006]MBP2581637.1 hypothetical protein [Streptomyces sp. PvR006]
MTAFPPLHEYALAHSCPTCKVKPGEPCRAPRKAAALAARNGLRAELGLAPIEDPGIALHLARHDAGRRHYRRDVVAAPWPEDRIPGQRYDTLGGAA